VKFYGVMCFESVLLLLLLLLLLLQLLLLPPLFLILNHIVDLAATVPTTHARGSLAAAAGVIISPHSLVHLWLALCCLIFPNALQRGLLPPPVIRLLQQQHQLPPPQLQRTRSTDESRAWS
jgi:hypothetical protein